MVKTQAHMMLRATPQWTALKRCTLPTPMMPPAMVWVVETGMPAMAVPSRLTAAAVSAQKPPTGFSRVILMPMVFTMRQPPAMVPRAMAAWAISTTQKGNVKPLEDPGGKESSGDDAHGLLRVVGSVAKAVSGGREELQLAEILVHALGRPGLKDPIDRKHQRSAENESDGRGEDDESEHLAPSAQKDDVPPRLGDCGSGISPDQGVRGTDGQPVVPSQDIPEDRPHQAGQDHVEVDGLQPDHSIAHGPGYGGSEGEGGNKIEESRPEDGNPRR